MKRVAGFLLLAVVLTSAGIAQPASRDANKLRLAARDVAISRFAVPGPGSVNTWIIEGPTAVVVVDMQRDTESASAAIEKIKATGKEVAGLLLTHPHPDHIGGVDQFAKAFPQAPIIASKLTAAEIRSDARGFQKATRETMPNAPASYPEPTRLLAGRPEIVLAGITIRWREFGSAEGPSATAYFLPTTGALFSGDLIGNEVADFFLEGKTSAWLRELTVMAAAYPKATVVYPGHGSAGEPRKLIKEQRDYIQVFRDQVRRQVEAVGWNGSSLADSSRDAVVKAVESRFPGRQPVAALPDLQAKNADAVAKELTKK